MAVAEWVSAPDCAPSPVGKLFAAPPPQKRAEKWPPESLELLLPVIFPLPSRTLTPFQTIGGAANTIQWWVGDVETFASWGGDKKKKKRHGSGGFISSDEIEQPYQNRTRLLFLNPPHSRDSPASKPSSVPLFR